MISSTIFESLFVIVPIFIILVFVFTFMTILSPKFRGKMMSRQIKATKYMMDESREDIESISRDMANATEDGVETTSRAIKRGFSSSSKKYCKNCGTSIDSDSHYCKRCGKMQ